MSKSYSNGPRQRAVGIARLVATLMVLAMSTEPRSAASQEAGGQTAERILAGCDAAAAAEDESAMNAAADRAEGLAATMDADGLPVEGLVIRAEVLSRCRIPFAAPMRRGTLVDESNDLLIRALRRDPSHLGARFVLGMNHYATPAFLNRTEAAIEAFSRLIELHGDLRDQRVATAYLLLGELYARTGRDGDAARAWAAGASRFPDHPGLGEKANDPGPDAALIPPGPRNAAPPLAYTLEPIVVESGGYSMDDVRAATRLSRTDVYTLPGGAADVLQAFQAMPGVTRVGDGADLYVRGGDAAESPVYVDGARLPYPGRFETLNGSMFGVLDPAALRRAYYSSGGFSSRYGNALSGIVDIETEGRPLERRWRLGANLTSLGGTLWQPLGSATGAWGTAMITSTRPLLVLHGRLDDYPDPPGSFQGMAGATWEPRPGVEVKGTALVESDATSARVSAYGYDGTFRSESRTRLVSASGRYLTRDGRAELRFSTGVSGNDGGFEFGVLDRDRADRSISSRLDAALERGRLQVRAGLELARMRAEREGTVPAEGALAPGSPVVILGLESEAATHAGLYGELETRVSERLAVIVGMRADELPGEATWTLDPRVGVAYRLADWTLRAGGGVFSQGRWRTRYEVPEPDRPSGIPLRADHLIAGVQHDGSVSLRAEAYYKRYRDYDMHPPGVEFIGDPGPEALAGRTLGLDVLLQWTESERLTGWLTYSLIDAEIELAGGARVPSEFDATHTATAVARLSAGEAWEFGATVRYGTGRPFTPVVGATEPEPGRFRPVYGAIHSARQSDYFRIDGRITRLHPTPGGFIVTYLEVLNLLDRANVAGYTYDATYRERLPIDSFFGDRTLVFGAEVRF